MWSKLAKECFSTAREVCIDMTQYILLMLLSSITIYIWTSQERIEPAKPAREHATSIDGEIQTLASGY